MLRFARFVAAVFAFPFNWALCLTFVDAIYMSSGNSRVLFSAESIALFSGLILFLVIWKAFPGLTRIYVLGHELTHALWGLAFSSPLTKKVPIMEAAIPTAASSRGKMAPVTL